MNAKSKLVFWVAALVVLTLLFSQSFGSLALGFYFVSFLFPVVLGTSLFFNQYLVPRYLMAGKRRTFALYFAYMLIVSVYLEMVVMVAALAILANYQIKNLGKIAGDIYPLTITLYLIVFIDGFINTLRGLRLSHGQVARLEEKNKKNTVASIVVMSNRRQVRLATAQIAWIESLGDYVKIHTTTQTVGTKTKISTLQASLPDTFVRIHRSFLVNQAHVDSFNREEVTVAKHELPIGRTYKKAALTTLSEQTSQG